MFEQVHLFLLHHLLFKLLFHLLDLILELHFLVFDVLLKVSFDSGELSIQVFDLFLEIEFLLLFLDYLSCVLVHVRNPLLDFIVSVLCFNEDVVLVFLVLLSQFIHVFIVSVDVDHLIEVQIFDLLLTEG